MPSSGLVNCALGLRKDMQIQSIQEAGCGQHGGTGDAGELLTFSCMAPFGLKV